MNSESNNILSLAKISRRNSTCSEGKTGDARNDADHTVQMDDLNNVNVESNTVGNNQGIDEVVKGVTGSKGVNKTYNRIPVTSGLFSAKDRKQFGCTIEEAIEELGYTTK